MEPWPLPRPQSKRARPRSLDHGYPAPGYRSDNYISGSPSRPDASAASAAGMHRAAPVWTPSPEKIDWGGKARASPSPTSAVTPWEMIGHNGQGDGDRGDSYAVISDPGDLGNPTILREEG
jgi:hypothetical protein